MKSIFKYSLVILSCVFLVTISCEDLDLEGEEAGDVRGFWELNRTTGSNTFLLISDTEVIFYFYDSIEDCITVDAYEVVRIDGTGFYILTQEGLEENRVLAISRSADRIHVRDIDETQEELDRYWISEVDINTLAPVCNDPSNVFGEWELTHEDGYTIYLSITQDTIKVIDEFAEQNCFFISALEILEINGNIFTLADNDPSTNSETQEVKIIKIPEGIEVERIENGELIIETYIESDADFSTFVPVCDFEPFDEILGIWQLDPQREEGSLYIDMNGSELTYYFKETGSECYIADRYAIIFFDGEELQIQAGEDPPLTYGINIENGRLMTTFENEESEEFVRSSLSIEDLSPICSPDFAGDLLGKWQYNSTSEEDVEFYLTITQVELNFHFRIGDPINNPDGVCFEIEAYAVLELGEGYITIQETEEPFERRTFNLDFNESEGLLYIDDGVEVLDFFRTNINDDYINNQCVLPVVPAN